MIAVAKFWDTNNCSYENTLLVVFDTLEGGYKGGSRLGVKSDTSNEGTFNMGGGRHMYIQDCIKCSKKYGDEKFLRAIIHPDPCQRKSEISFPVPWNAEI